MRLTRKVMLWACCAVPAVAAMALSGTGTAGATPVSPAIRTVGFPSFGVPGCDPLQLEQWNLGKGANTVALTYRSGNYTYSVNFTQNGSCLGGTLHDGYYPYNAAISGTVSGNAVTFTIRYPAHSIQGTRTFGGTISSGIVTGTWSETGSEHGSGTWSLTARVAAACRVPSRRGCQVGL